ncbi:VV20781 family protein [Tsuneonella sp. HG222]
MRKIVLTLLAAGLLSGCATPAMEVPAALAMGTERITFEHMSGWNRGRFVAGEYAGDYFRTLDRASLGLVNVTEGRGRFTVAGPGISDTIEGDCGVSEAALAFDNIEIKPGKMAYRCDLTAAGRAFPARFEVQESRASLAENLNRNARVGEIALAGQVIRFRSVHKFETPTLPTRDPLGYVFEQDGQPIGALELNGKPYLLLPAGTDLDRRRAMMVASVALATFWDPGVIDS